MAEPTIDEMLDAVDALIVIENLQCVRELEAIRAILEQHRDTSIDRIRAVISEERGRDLLIIRAFVERVEKRAFAEQDVRDDPLLSDNHRLYAHRHYRAFREELVALEKECQ